MAILSSVLLCFLGLVEGFSNRGHVQTRSPGALGGDCSHVERRRGAFTLGEWVRSDEIQAGSGINGCSQQEPLQLDGEETKANANLAQGFEVAEDSQVRIAEKQEDSIEWFEKDVTRVLQQLRSDYYDPTIPKMHHLARSFTNAWNVQTWKRHRSRWRYVDFLVSLPRSRVLCRILPQLLILSLWSLCTVRFFPNVSSTGVFSLTPLSLISTFVAALLTLRSNQGLTRLKEGRIAVGKVVLYSRDLSQMVAASIYPKDPALGLLTIRHLALFPWLLKGFLRGAEVNGNDEDIIRTLLPPSCRRRRLCRQPEEATLNYDYVKEPISPDAAYLLQRERKRPAAILTRLRQIFAELQGQGQLTTSEASRLDYAIQQLNQCITSTERIIASPIPPVYTEHTCRLLIFYLFHLPLSLRATNLMNGPGAVVATFMIGFAMFGLDEISHFTEEPFRLMPLYHISKNAMKDCADALICQPPPLPTLSSSSSATPSMSSLSVESSDGYEPYLLDDPADPPFYTKRPSYWSATEC